MSPPTIRQIETTYSNGTLKERCSLNDNDQRVGKYTLHGGEGCEYVVHEIDYDDGVKAREIIR